MSLWILLIHRPLLFPFPLHPWCVYQLSAIVLHFFVSASEEPSPTDGKRFLIFIFYVYGCNHIKACKIRRMLLFSSLIYIYKQWIYSLLRGPRIFQSKRIKFISQYSPKLQLRFMGSFYVVWALFIRVGGYLGFHTSSIQPSFFFFPKY